MSRSPSVDGLSYERAHEVAVELDHEQISSQSPKQWFEAAVKYAEAARAAERRGSRQGQYVAYTRLAIAYQKAKLHPKLKDARAADPQWANQVNEFKGNFEMALKKAKTLKEELKRDDSSTKPEGPSGGVKGHAAAKSVDHEHGGSIADRMKALSGHGMDVGSGSKRMSRDMAPPRSSGTAAAAGGGGAPPAFNWPAVPPSPMARRASQDLHHQRRPSLPRPPSISMMPNHGSSASLSGMNGISPNPTGGSTTSTRASPNKGSVPLYRSSSATSNVSTRANQVPSVPHSLVGSTAPLPPPADSPKTSTTRLEPQQTPERTALNPSPLRPSHPLPTPPTAPATRVESPNATERIDKFHQAFPSLDELGKQFDDDGFAIPALPSTISASNGPRHPLPELPKKDADDAVAFLGFPSLPSVPTDLPGTSRALPKPPLPPPPPAPRLDEMRSPEARLEDLRSPQARLDNLRGSPAPPRFDDLRSPPAPPRLADLETDGEADNIAAPSPPSPDLGTHARPASTLGFSAQNSLSLSPFTTPHASVLDEDAKLKVVPQDALYPPSPSKADLSSPEPLAVSPVANGQDTFPPVSPPPVAGPSSPAVKAQSPPAKTLVMPVPMVAPGPGPSNGALPRGPVKPNFPFTNSITPETLRSYFTNKAVQVLILDVRPADEFALGYIGTEYYLREGCGDINIVWIDPTVLKRPNLTSSQLEDALSLSPEAQQAAFGSRHLYDLVVISDMRSKAFPNKGAAQTAAGRLREIIYELEFTKTLPRSPVLLVGGYEGWVEFINGRRAFHMANHMRNAQPPQAQQYAPNGHSAPLAARPTNAGPPSPQQLANRDKPIYGAPAHYAKDVTENFSHNSPQSMSGPRQHHQYSASYSAGPASYTPYQQAPNPPQRPMPRASHASSNSISSAYNGYARPQHNRQDSFSNYDAPSGIAPPPRASVHTSAMTRRQSSGYMDYAAPGNAPRIDYPQAHALVRVPQPPPAAASHSLERQDQRMPVRLPPRGDQFGETGVRYWRDTKLGLTGLKNLGNTCYMNSTVQCLSATYPFARYFLDGAYKRDLNTTSNLGTKGRMAKAFADLLGALWGEDWNCLSPITFRQSIIGFNDLFAGNQQHDSQEFLSFVLDGLHEDLNRVKVKPQIDMTPEREKALEALPPQIASDKEWQLYKQRDDSFIVDLFQGQYMSRTTCLTCRKTSTVYDSFMWLTLDLPVTKGKVMLPELVDRWVQPETLSVEDGWVCTHCKTKRKATKALTLVRLPPVLLIQLKRFSFSGGFWNRSDTPVIFPINNLDLTRFVPRREATGGENLDDPRCQVGPFKYDLYGLTNHSGTLSSGHYTAFIRSSGRWMFAEDSRISPASERDVISHPAASYILFYKRVQA